MLKKRIFIHQNIPYAFNWNINNHKAKLSQLNPRRKEFIKLGTYFKRVYQGDIPNNLFNTREYHRISQFKIHGIKISFLNSLSKKLIRDQKIRYLDSTSELPQYAQNVFQSFNIKTSSAIVRYLKKEARGIFAVRLLSSGKVTVKYSGGPQLLRLTDSCDRVLCSRCLPPSATLQVFP